MKTLLYKHYLIIVLAVRVGFLSSFPQYLATYSVPGFAGIYNQVVNDGVYYEARSHEVLDGYIYLTNPYLYEHKDGAPMQFWIPDVLLAKPIEWLHLSVPVGFIIWTFILTFLLTIFSYAICFALTGSTLYAFFGAFTLHISLFSFNFLRLPSPSLNFIFWLSSLLFLILFIQKKKWLYAVIASLSFGMLFHLYPYYWTFFVVLYSVFIFLLAFHKYFNKEKLTGLLPYIFICVGALIIGIPYFLSVYQSTKFPWYKESIMRLGMIETHFPSGISSVVVAFILIILFIVFWLKKIIKRNEISILLFSGLISTIIVINQHLITGKNLEFSSHYFLGNMFFYFFAFIYLIFVFIQRLDLKYQKVVFVFLFSVSLVFGIISEKQTIQKEMTYQPGEIYFQNYAPVFDWLNKNAKTDDVVFANDDLSYLIPVYTSQNVFFSPLSVLFFMTQDEVEQRFFTEHYFDKIDDKFLITHQREIFGGYYINMYGHNRSINSVRKIFGLQAIENDILPKVEISRLMITTKIVQSNTFENNLKKYKVDYIIWDSNKDRQWKMQEMKSLKQVYVSLDIIVFKIK